MIPTRSAHAVSWSPSLRVAGAVSTWEFGAPFASVGLIGHVVHEDAYVRVGIEVGWWEQIGSIGTSHAADTGNYAEKLRFTNFLTGGVVHVAPGRRAPFYLALGVSDLVVVTRAVYTDESRRSEWSHAPSLSGGFGFADRNGFGPIVELRWYRRRGDEGIDDPNRFFTASAGVRF